MIDLKSYYPYLKPLKTQTPELYDVLTTKFSRPGYWSDGEHPLDDMFSYGDSLKLIMDHGYDPNLIVDTTNQYFKDTPWSSQNPRDRLLFDFDDVGTDIKYSEGIINQFPSDYSKGPASQSAQMLETGGVPQIGNSDYTIDNLRMQGMSEDAILALLRKLSAKGYEI